MARWAGLTVFHEFGPSFLRPRQVGHQLDFYFIQRPMLQEFLCHGHDRLPLAGTCQRE
jgi:hypothetical protein